MSDQVWRVRFRTRDGEWEGSLVADWEVEQDPISDDYSPGEMAAEDLLQLWAKRVREHFPNGLIPIRWHVESQGGRRCERMPFQFNHDASSETRPRFASPCSEGPFHNNFRAATAAVTSEFLAGCLPGVEVINIWAGVGYRSVMPLRDGQPR